MSPAIFVLLFFWMTRTSEAANSSRNLRYLCSEGGWLQDSYFCKSIVSRVKAALCRVVTIDSCKSTETSATANPPIADSGDPGPPYWVIDDISGMNITVFFNITGFAAPASPPYGSPSSGSPPSGSPLYGSPSSGSPSSGSPPYASPPYASPPSGSSSFGVSPFGSPPPGIPVTPPPANQSISYSDKLDLEPPAIAANQQIGEVSKHSATATSNQEVPDQISSQDASQDLTSLSPTSLATENPLSSQMPHQNSQPERAVRQRRRAPLEDIRCYDRRFISPLQ
ncbi:Hypothetical protein NTJ_13627 [Nesidiocoris tenuis]|uniref:Uncharacterized protein n=1 Tax=Nesidiocoris tenuis TaxID=355587 RepID=A0ABN7B8U6_9HEMI|nr:Hypothetical protein NTJ_13627 [Nesidiocoris tenuis]